MSEVHPLVETWQISSRITLYLLESIKTDYLTDQLTPRGLNIGQQFAHLHNNRREWLEGYQDLQEKLPPIKPEKATDIKILKAALVDSGAAMAEMIRRGVVQDNIIGFERHPSAFVGYMVAHEAFHHGKIVLMLEQAGHAIERISAVGMWEWDKR